MATSHCTSRDVLLSSLSFFPAVKTNKNLMHATDYCKGVTGVEKVDKGGYFLSQDCILYALHGI